MSAHALFRVLSLMMLITVLVLSFIPSKSVDPLRLRIGYSVEIGHLVAYGIHHSLINACSAGYAGAWHEYWPRGEPFRDYDRNASAIGRTGSQHRRFCSKRGRHHCWNCVFRGMSALHAAGETRAW